MKLVGSHFCIKFCVSSHNRIRTLPPFLIFSLHHLEMSAWLEKYVY